MSDARTSDTKLCGLCGWKHSDNEPCPPLRETLTSNHQSIAARDVLAERRRQIQSEGWTPEHDDQHSNFELTLAAVCYALCAARPKPEWLWGNGETPQWWPWAKGWWKPRGARPELVRAAALIIAEIERLDRANGVSGASAAETGEPPAGITWLTRGKPDFAHWRKDSKVPYSWCDCVSCSDARRAVNGEAPHIGDTK